MTQNQNLQTASILHFAQKKPRVETQGLKTSTVKPALRLSSGQAAKMPDIHRLFLLGPRFRGDDSRVLVYP